MIYMVLNIEDYYGCCVAAAFSSKERAVAFCEAKYGAPYNETSGTYSVDEMAFDDEVVFPAPPKRKAWIVNYLGKFPRGARYLLCAAQAREQLTLPILVTAAAVIPPEGGRVLKTDFHIRRLPHRDPWAESQDSTTAIAIPRER